MKPSQYFAHFSSEARLMFWLTFGLGLLCAIAFTIPVPKPTGIVVMIVLFVPVFFGSMLGQAVHALETRPNSVLLPGLRQGLWAWNTAVLVLVSWVWGRVVHAAVPDLSVTVATAVSLAIAAMPLVQQPRRSRWLSLAPALGILFGSQYEFGGGQWATVAPFFREHATAITLVAVLTAAWHLWTARNWTRIRRLELTLGETGPFSWSTVRSACLADLRIWNNDRDLGRQRRSLPDWVRAIHLESPGVSHTSGLSLVAVILMLVFPLIRHSGGYPLAWYRMVFRWDDGAGALYAVFLWLGLIAVGLAAPMPRRDVLYPIPRRSRAKVAFWSSAGTWMVILGAWVGGSLLLATLAGWWLRLPMPAGAIVRFTAPATLSFFVLPILRLVGLHCEGRSEATMWVTVIVTVPLTIIGWFGLSQLPPLAAVMVAVTCAGLGLAGYYVLLRDYFTGEDLIQPRPAKPVAVI